MARKPVPAASTALLAKGTVPVDIDKLASRHTLILYNRGTAVVAGEHEVVTLPGGSDSPDDPADALELPATGRGQIARHRHAGKIPHGKQIRFVLKAGNPVVELVTVKPPQVPKPRRPR